MWFKHFTESCLQRVNCNLVGSRSRWKKKSCDIGKGCICAGWPIQSMPVKGRTYLWSCNIWHDGSVARHSRYDGLIKSHSSVCERTACHTRAKTRGLFNQLLLKVDPCNGDISRILLCFRKMNVIFTTCIKHNTDQND